MSTFTPDLTEQSLSRLLSKGEGHFLDFKRAHLATSLPEGERDRKRGEWMKDILAFANTPRTQPAFILVGVSNDRQVVGITEPRDDASFQALFRDKTNRSPVFRYYEIETAAGARVGAFEIPADQPRPIYLKRPFGSVCECVVYVRHGSTNAPLEPDRWRDLHPRAAAPGEPVPATQRQDVRALTARWLGLFEVHGVKHHQIPALLPDHYLPLGELTDWRQIASLLDERLRADTCQLFNVRPEWLVGDSPRIYESRAMDFECRPLLDALEEWVPTCQEVAILGFRDGRKPLEVSPRQRCAFMLRGTIREFGEKPVFKYQPLYDVFDWDYPKGRLIAKVAWLVARHAGCLAWGWRLSTEQIQHLCGGRVLPDTILVDPWGKNWHPDDFVDSAASAVSKETEERESAMQIVRANGAIDKARSIRLAARRARRGEGT